MLSPCLGLLLPAFRPLQETGGDVCRLLVWVFCYQLSDLAGYWGRCLPTPCLGLYYLLSGLRRILGEMYAVLLVWVWEMYAVLLVWVWASTTCFQAFAGCWGRCMLFSLSGSGPLLPAFRPLQDAEGDVCCSIDVEGCLQCSLLCVSVFYHQMDMISIIIGHYLEYMSDRTE